MEIIIILGLAGKEAAFNVLDFPEQGEDTLKASNFEDTVIYVPPETAVPKRLLLNAI